MPSLVGPLCPLKKNKIGDMTVIAAVVCFLGIISPVELSPHEHPTGAILVSDNYTRCKDVNLHTLRLVCEIHSQEDEMKIERFGLSGCFIYIYLFDFQLRTCKNGTL